MTARRAEPTITLLVRPADRSVTQPRRISSTPCYMGDREYLVTVTSLGDRLTIHVNAVEVASLRDHAFDSGGLGLACTDNETAAFTRVSVLEPRWEAFHRVHDAKPRSAGALLEARGAGEAEPDSAVLTEVVAEYTDPGTSVLRAGDLTVRLRGTGGDVIHERTFTENSGFAPLDVRLLRGRDGTRFLVLPSDPPAAGVLRIDWRYRRSAGDALPVLAQRGDTTDETPIIDIPWATLVLPG